MRRAENIVQKISADYGITWEDVLAQTTSGATIGRPHIADALVALGLVRDRGVAFDTILHPRAGYFEPHYAPDPLEGVRLITAAGGVAVLAHPATRGRDEVIPEERLAKMVDAGLFGLEIDHRENTAPGKERLARTRTALLARNHRFERLSRRRQTESARREHHRAARARSHPRARHRECCGRGVKAGGRGLSDRPSCVDLPRRLEIRLRVRRPDCVDACADVSEGAGPTRCRPPASLSRRRDPTRPARMHVPVEPAESPERPRERSPTARTCTSRIRRIDHGHRRDHRQRSPSRPPERSDCGSRTRGGPAWLSRPLVPVGMSRSVNRCGDDE